MTWISIDGIDLPTPARCTLQEYDQDAASSGRSEAGYMHRDRVRAKLLNIDNIEWTHLTPENAALIRTALSPVFFNVTVQFVGGPVTKKMYAGDLKWTPDFVDGTPRWNLSAHLTEC